MISVEECISRIKAELKPVKDTEAVGLEGLVGRVNAGMVCAPVNLPPFPKSAMDGFAVKAEDVKDTPVTLKVLGTMFAGDDKDFRYAEGSAVRIMTGARVPDGFDAVVRQEDTTLQDGEVTVLKGVKTHTNYCGIGEDVKQGQVILPPGLRIRPIDVSVLAGVGICEVEVRRRIRASVLSTGSELQEPGAPLMPGRIYQNITQYLSALMKDKGVDVVSCGICEDEKVEIISKIRALLPQNDIIITTGGVSVGQKDLLPEVLSDMGAKVLFHGADIKPGTPTMAAVLDGKLLLCLSGNPYAAIVNFEIYFWEAFCALGGNYKPYTTLARFAGEYSKVNSGRRFLRAFYKDGQVWINTSKHMSSVISNMSNSNCLIDLETGRTLTDGGIVNVRLLSDAPSDYCSNNKVFTGGIVNGGKSTRMGKDKSSLTVGGKSFLARKVSELETYGAGEVLLSAAKEDGNTYTVRTVMDEFDDRGPIEGIRRLLMESKTEWVFVSAVDIQNVRREAFDLLYSYLSGDVDAVVYGSPDGKAEPLFAFYRKTLIPEIEDLVSQHEYKIRGVFESSRTKYVPMKYEIRNVNDPSDYKKLLIPRVISVCGVKNSGKTTLIESLIPLFTADGFKVGVIKHDGHEFTMDRDGTDTSRFIEAGAYKTAIFSETRHAVIGGKTDAEALTGLFEEADVIIVEGLKDSSLPKIEVVRDGISSEPVSNEPLLIATDIPTLCKETSGVDLNNATEIYRRLTETV